MRLLRASAIVASATLMSRLLGLFRDQLFAGVLGASGSADAFLAAFRLPNLFRRLFAEGLFPAAFLPLFARRLQEEGAAEARLLAGRILTPLAFFLIIATILAEIFMPQLMTLLAGGLAEEPDIFAEAVLYARIAFPYLFCMVLLALFSAILNAASRFFAAAAAPILLNLSLILSLLTAARLGMGGLILSWGVMAAGILQAGTLIWACRRAALLPLFETGGAGVGGGVFAMTDDFRLFGKSAAPVLATGLAGQMMILLGTRIASEAEGGIALLYYAERLYQLPLALIGIGISVALLPELSRRWAKGEERQGRAALGEALYFAMLLALPAAAALFVIAHPIITALFQYGAFTERDALQSSYILAAFAPGLPAFILARILQTAFFARGDRKTPLLLSLVSLGIYAPAALFLFWRFGLVGIAAATSLAFWVQSSHLVFLLKKRMGAGAPGGQPRLFPKLPNMTLAALLMGAALHLLSPFAASLMAARESLFQTALHRGIALAGLVLFGLLFYACLCRIFRAASLKNLKEALGGGRDPDQET